jgi:3-oxoacyl-[acyl-carrier protein] reductase
MDLGLTDKVAFITGASRGIGKGIARSLAREGCKVALTATRADLLKAVAQDIRSEFGVEAAWWTGDLLHTADADRVVNAAAAHFGRIDILVNNAGAAPGGVLETLSDEAWESGIGLKFMGYVRVTRAVLPYMQRQRGGRVVNLIGNDGVKQSYWEIVPGAANAAGQNFTIALAGQYGKDNISFCAVNPGPVRTERWTGLVQAMARDMKLSFEQADQLAPASIPLGRIAEVEEVADLVTYLASPKAHFVNGTMIEIDGGQMKPIMDAKRDQV